MNNTENITKAIIDQGMLPLYFNADETVSTEILRSLYEGGVRVLEYTIEEKPPKQILKKWWKCAMVNYLVCCWE